MLDHRVYVCLDSTFCYRVFKMVTELILLPTMYESLFTFLSTLSIFCLLNFSHSGGYVMVLYRVFDLPFYISLMSNDG